MDAVIQSRGARLVGHLGRPPNGAPARRGLVLAHGFPTGVRWSESSGRTYPEFADRLAEDTGWTVLAFSFRGTGVSTGDFSVQGWVDDIRASVDFLIAEAGVRDVWLAGFRTGGAAAIREAADDPRVRGVATFGAPADFDIWAADPERFLEVARELGTVRTPEFPQDLSAWVQELKMCRAIDHVDQIPPRPLLIVHGSLDDVVPEHDARVLADAAGEGAELRIIQGAGHRLRHDPRAVAVLMGWLERQD